MENSIREFSGREFSPEDIEQIKWVRKTYQKLSEKELACTICEIIGWLTPSGQPKVTQCLGFLDQLANEGLITLPIKQMSKARKQADFKRALLERTSELIEGETITTLNGPLGLEIAQAGPRLKLLRACLEKYHTLGDDQIYGDRLYYFIKDGETELGCMRFSSSSWALENRDQWIGWDASERKSRLFLIVNQSRFLIFPYVRVKNLASRTLSLTTKRIASDWLARYCYEPVLIETFVDRSKYHGTVYKASNWELVGQTKGRGRNDRYNEHALSVKDIYMQPLRRDFRAVLKGDVPYKAVNPDE